MKWLHRLFAPAVRPYPAIPRQVRPMLESLEDRVVPTVTEHGGNLLNHVEVQGVYYGSDWLSQSALYQQTGQLEGYLTFLVDSGYMDML